MNALQRHAQGLYAFASSFASAGIANLVWPLMVVEDVDLTGKTCIITGANAGLGKDTAAVLARMGATVVLACRNLSKAEAAKQEIREKTGKDVEVEQLDTSDLESVRAFVKRWAARPKARRSIYFLSNNAGALSDRKNSSKQGHEFTYATNHLGGFLLTLSLLPYMEQDARISFTSSLMLFIGWKLTKDNLDDQSYVGKLKEGHVYGPMYATRLYAQTKGMQALFAQELGRRFKAKGIRIHVHAHNPGVVRTDIWTKGEYGKRAISELWNAGFISVIGLSPQQGALGQVFIAVDPRAADPSNNGCYFDRLRTRWMPAYFADQKNTDAVFVQWERDAGLTFDEAISKMS